MKKVILVSFAAAVCLSATEYNVFVISLNKPDYDKLNPIKDKVEKVIKSSKYANDVVVKARPSEPYHTVVVETNDISKSKVTEIRNYIRKNTAFKDAYFTTRAAELARIEKYKKSNDIKDETPVAPLVVVEPAKKSSSTSSLLDSLNNDKKLELEVPEFKNKENANSVTLQKAVVHVLNTNPSIKTNEQEYLLSLKDLDIASAAYYPMLNLYANAGYAKRNEKQHKKETRDGSGEKYDVSLVLTENLYNGGKDKNTKKQQNHITNATAYKVIQNANELSYETSRAYLEYIRTKLMLQIAEDNVKSHEEIYSLIKDRTSAGFARASEERQAGSRLALAKTNLLSAKNDYEDARNKFTRLYGSNVDIESFVMPVSTNLAPSDLAKINEISTKCNPTLKIEEENLNALNYAYKASKSAYLPKLDLELSAEYENNKIFKDVQQDQEDKQLGAFLRFSYNIFNKGQDKLNVQRTEVSMQSGRLNYDEKLREILESNSFAFNSHNVSIQKLEYLNSYVDYAKKTLLTYQDEFKLGKRDLINVLDAQSEYFNAAREMVNTKNNILLTEYKLINNMGLISENFANGYAKKYISFACTLSDMKQ